MSPEIQVPPGNLSSAHSPMTRSNALSTVVVHAERLISRRRLRGTLNPSSGMIALGSGEYQEIGPERDSAMGKKPL
jgi:hypothetical protein